MSDELCIEVDDLTLTGLTAETYVMFWAMRAKRERPFLLGLDKYCETYPYIRQSDNLAIRAKAARLVPERITDVPAA